MAQTGGKEGIELEGNYSADELNEYVNTLRKLFVVRDVVLKVNQQYIASAGQADAYRTEPPFLLQGSYRNMNRIASRILPVMNDQELWTHIFSSYEQDAQTLTSGAESNLLKFRELIGRLDDKHAARWSDIKKTFCRNKLLGGNSDDKISQVIGQLNAFGAGLDAIRDTIADSVTTLGAKAAEPSQAGLVREQFDQLSGQVLERLNQVIAAIKEQGAALAQRQTEHGQLEEAKQSQKNTEMLVSVLEEQFRTLETWLIPVHQSDADRVEYFEHLMERFETMVSGYNRLMDALKKKYEPLLKNTKPETPSPSKPSNKKGTKQ